MNPPTRRVLIASALTDLRWDVAARLAADGITVLAEGAGVDLELVGRVFAPHVAVVDMVRGRGADHPVGQIGTARTILLLTDDLDAVDIAAAWRLGAADIAPDPTDADDVRCRVLQQLRVAGTVAASGVDDLVIDEAGHVVRRDDAELQLTLTEFRLLLAFVRNSGVVMSKRQLLAGVWGFDDYDVNLVEVHVSALRRKLEAHGPRIIHTVRGIGYVLRRPQSPHPQSPHPQSGHRGPGHAQGRTALSVRRRSRLTVDDESSHDGLPARRPRAGA